MSSAETKAPELQEKTLADEKPVTSSDEHPHSLRGDILFGFAVALGLYVAWQVRSVILLLYVSALFAVVLTPVVEGMMRMRIRIGGRAWSPGKGVSILLLMLGVAGGLTLFFVFAIPPVVHDLKEFVSELPSRGPQLLSRLRNLPLAGRIDLEALNAKVQDYASNFASYILSSIGNWAGKAVDVVTAIVLTVYFMLEGDVAYRWTLSLFPRERRLRLDRTLKRAGVRMGGWLLGQLLLMLTLGVTSGVVFGLLHVRYVWPLAVLMGLFNIIPVVGGLISICAAALAAAIDSWGKVVGVLVFMLIYAQIENAFLVPKIMKSRVDLAGLAVMVALLLGASVAGIVGAMVSVPTAVLVTVLIEEYLVHRDAQQAEPAD